MQQDRINFDVLAESVRYSFSPLVAVRGGLRDRLLQEGWIRTFADRPVDTDPVVGSLAAVDGGAVRERFYLQDLLAVRAAAANGSVSPRHPLPVEAEWARLVTRSADTSRALAAAMAAAELYLLGQASHDVRVLDGGFVTPLIGLRDGLKSRDTECWAVVEELFEGHWQALGNLESLYSSGQSRPVLAVTKADTGRDYLKAVAADPTLGVDGDTFGPVADRVFAAHLLNPGEYLTPVAAHVAAASPPPDASDTAAVAAAKTATGRVAKILAERSAGGELRSTFFKPYRSGHAVVKVDYLADSAHTAAAAAERYVEALNQDCRMPHALEPYALWKVDALVKQVSELPDKVRRGILSRLNVEERATFGPFLNRKHRT